MKHFHQKTKIWKTFLSFSNFDIRGYPWVKFDFENQLYPICLINGSFESPLKTELNSTKHSFINSILSVKNGLSDFCTL